MAVLLDTSAGEIVIDLYVDECPIATENFLKLCKIKYYNGCLFYNVQQNFIAQTGDPTGLGRGGNSIYGLLRGSDHTFFKDEINKNRKFDKVGLVCYAHTGGHDNSNRSQFFITLRAEDMEDLEGKFTIFGEIAEGHDVLEKLNNLYCDEDSRPFQDVRIRHTYVLDDSFPDPPGLLVPPSPERDFPVDEKVKRRIPYEEDLENNKSNLTEEDLEASIKRKEAQSRAMVLEMTGDLPDADVKPPVEVLFVCKLNPVTRDEDLELIFSRFGVIKSCEIIRDPKTGDSLNFAFIEFDSEDACINAYEKMNNVLIDDRRIKVDFSQSVSHLWNRFLQQPRKANGASHAGTTSKPFVHKSLKPPAESLPIPSANRPMDQRSGDKWTSDKDWNDRRELGRHHQRSEANQSNSGKVVSQHSQRYRDDSRDRGNHRTRESRDKGHDVKDREMSRDRSHDRMKHRERSHDRSPRDRKKSRDDDRDGHRHRDSEYRSRDKHRDRNRSRSRDRYR